MDNKHKSIENLIQELKELRQELAETKERVKVFQGIADYTADLENFFGPDGKLLWINQLVYELSGYKAEECYEMHDYPLPLIYEADKEKAKQCFQSAVEGVSGHDVELRIVCKDGGIKWVSASWRPMYDENGHHIGHRSSVRDITGRKQIEEEKERLAAVARQERDRLSALIDSISDEVWFADMNGEFSLANQAAVLEFNLSNSKKDIDIVNLAKNLEVYYPDGSPRPVEEAPPLRALKGEVVKNQDEIIWTPAGDGLRYRQVSSNPVRDVNGQIIGSVSVVRDITDQKKTEFALRESEDRFRAFMDNSPGISWIKDEECRHVYLSKSYEKRFGVKIEDWLGKTDFELWPPEIAMAFHENDLAVLQDGQLRSVIEKALNSDGLTSFWLNSKFLIKDSTGRKYVCGSGVDITEEKRLEEELRKQRDNLAKMVEKRTEELEKKSLILEEANTTLKVLLDQREKDKEAIQDNIIFNVHNLVMPYIDKLKIHSLGTQEDAYLNTLEYALQNIISPFARRLASITFQFTSREIQISNFIRDGKSTKEICNILNLSVRAVEFHRDNIRKKLGLNKTNKNLRSYLLSLS